MTRITEKISDMISGILMTSENTMKERTPTTSEIITTSGTSKVILEATNILNPSTKIYRNHLRKRLGFGILTVQYSSSPPKISPHSAM